MLTLPCNLSKLIGWSSVVAHLLCASTCGEGRRLPSLLPYPLHCRGTGQQSFQPATCTLFYQQRQHCPKHSSEYTRQDRDVAAILSSFMSFLRLMKHGLYPILLQTAQQLKKKKQPINKLAFRVIQLYPG